MAAIGRMDDADAWDLDRKTAQITRRVDGIVDGATRPFRQLQPKARGPGPGTRPLRRRRQSRRSTTLALRARERVD